MALGTPAIVVFLMILTAVVLVATLVSGSNSKMEARLGKLSRNGEPTSVAEDAKRVSKLASTALPKMGRHLLPADEKERTLLRSRLILAGFYSRQAMSIFLGVKLLLMTFPPVALSTLCALGLLPTTKGLVVGSFCGLLGMIGPSFWLDRRRKARQNLMRRGLPDALDVIVICLEGGLSFPAALRQVAGEMREAHPILAAELDIVQREIQLGQSPGEALRHSAERTDLDDLRTLSTVIIQSDRFGASLVKAFRIQAEALRQLRHQRAEVKAQRAATMVLLPTLLFIFPALFVVILGPAAMQMSRTLGSR